MKKILNPPNPYVSAHVEWIDCEPVANLHVYEEEAKSIISKNRSLDVGFDYSVNPYRGCFHGCSYCYARPTHQYIDFGAGSDFERKLVVKVNAARLLRDAFMKRSWGGDRLVFSGVTDCYQPLEAFYEVTRQCLSVCNEFKNPVAIITKGALIRRDIDILTSLSRDASVKVFMSVAFTDDKMSKLIEPGAPRPSVRFRAMKELTDAGIEVGVALAPVIPGLNDSQVSSVLEHAAQCGATSAFMTLLRLPKEVKEVFFASLQAAYPTRFQKVTGALKEMRSGNFNSTSFGERMRGQGSRWSAIQFLFEESCRKFGINLEKEGERGEMPQTFERPQNQLRLAGL